MSTRRSAGRILIVLAMLASLTAVPAGAHDSADGFVQDGRAALEARSGFGADHGASADRTERSRNLTSIGATDLDGRGGNADVWALGDYAYVGTWGIFGLLCPATGTAIVDISDPTNPWWAATAPTEPSTQTNDVKAATVDTPYFTGDLLVMSNEDCAPGGARGFEVVDVTDPLNPVTLSRYGPATTVNSPPEFAAWGFGTHNLYIFEQGARVYVAAVMDFSEIASLFFGIAPSGDIRIVDITDPANPVEVGSWGIVQDLGINPFDPSLFANPFESGPHDVWVEKGIAYVSYWDAGLILLDVSDPSHPTLISRAQYAAGEEGNTHVAVPARGGNVVIVGDEDFSPSFGGDNIWGFGRVFDAKKGLTEIATFDTGNVTASPALGDWTMHNVIVRGNTAYVSWYSDGMVLVDISQPANPRITGQYVPAAAADPYGILPTAPEMWGVYVHGSLILGSDMNSGLHILKHVPAK